jgi:predicted RNase H-like HicB family nuclease
VGASAVRNDANGAGKLAIGKMAASGAARVAHRSGHGCRTTAFRSSSRSKIAEIHVFSRTKCRRSLIDATDNGQMVINFALAPIAEAMREKVTALLATRQLSVRVGSRVFVAVLTPDLAAGGYSIEVPELPGVITEANTLPEARKMVADAIRLWQSVSVPTPKRRAR